MKTCGTCEHYNPAVLAGERQKGGTCHEKPPTPVLIGVANTPMGPRPHVIPWRPVVGEDEKACASFSLSLASTDLTALQLDDEDAGATRQ
jgi:hypothetical protein